VAATTLSSPVGQAGATVKPADMLAAQVSAPEAELILNPNDPMPSARAFVARLYMNDGQPTLKHQEGVFYEWQPESNVYAEITTARVKAVMYPFLEKAKRWEKKGLGQFELVDFEPTKAKVENVTDALRAITILPASGYPCWLGEAPPLEATDMLACKNGLLHVPTRKLYPATPAFFTLNGVDLDFDPEALQPVKWLAFLRTLWEDDEESINTLQEWFGYFLSPLTKQQKIAMLIGPLRGGKGTIARILRQLCGEKSYCAPTLASIGQQFGLAVLIGKSVAVVSDARIGGRTDTSILIERLLSISGEDTLSIPRKFLSNWTGKLSTRFLLISNELPRVEDNSGALASRFIIMTLTQSFLGREDPTLFDNLLPELPGILNWSLDGLDRLTKRGYFTQPSSSKELIERLGDLSSPVRAFLRDEGYEIKAGNMIGVDELYSQWRYWCLKNGIKDPGTVQTFSRDLHAINPWLKITRPRDKVTKLQVRMWNGIGVRRTETATDPKPEREPGADEPLEEPPF
jgi:putative DNA primase/helicase